MFPVSLKTVLVDEGDGPEDGNIYEYQIIGASGEMVAYSHVRQYAELIVELLNTRRVKII